MAELQFQAQSQSFSSSAWIGMYSNMSSWHWSLGYEPVGSMRKWEDGEPNNRGGCQNCVAMTARGWRDLDCTELRYFVCFDGKNLHVNFPNVSIENAVL